MHNHAMERLTMLKIPIVCRFSGSSRGSAGLIKTAGTVFLLALWMVSACTPAFWNAMQSVHAADAQARKQTEPAFSFASLEEEARRLAGQPYAPPEETIPAFLASLSLEQWQAIRSTPESDQFLNHANSPFQVRLLPPGYIFTHTVRINLVDGKTIRLLPFSPEMFAVADEKLADQMRHAQLGFAGFSLAYAGTTGSLRDEDAVLGLMGTSHFQFKGRKDAYGGDARPIALDTATPSGEQRPFFREYWLHLPDVDADRFVVHALMDSPGMTGAFEMTVKPGTSTVLDVHAKFFRRETGGQPKIGLAPVAGMFMFSETERGGAFDYRPEVHNCDGLLIAEADNKWQWVPLKNPQRLAISSFELARPRGFGLMQRDTDFDHYQDLRNRYEQCSSVWIEPKGDWGTGRIELVEIPSDRDYHSNIMAYWIPDEDSPLLREAGAPTPESSGAASPSFTLEYSLYWMPPDSPLHDLGKARDTRIARSPEAGDITFVIDFDGGALDALPADTGLTSVVDAPAEAPLIDKQLMKNDVTGGWRLVLKFGLPKNGVLDRLLTARDGPTPLRFSAYLKRGENLTDVLTEKWTYNLIP